MAERIGRYGSEELLEHGATPLFTRGDRNADFFPLVLDGAIQIFEQQEDDSIKVFDLEASVHRRARRSSTSAKS